MTTTGPLKTRATAHARKGKEVKVDAATASGSVLGLLEAVCAGLVGLEVGETDEGRLRADSEALVSELQNLRAGLKEQVQSCKEIRKKLDSPAHRNQFLNSLEEDPEEAATIRDRIVRTTAWSKTTEGIVDGLFKITSRRQTLGQIEEKQVRRATSSALTVATVALGEISEGTDALGASLIAFETSGLTAKLHACQIHAAGAGSRTDRQAAAKPTENGKSEKQTKAAEPTPVAEKSNATKNLEGAKSNNGGNEASSRPGKRAAAADQLAPAARDALRARQNEAASRDGDAKKDSKAKNRLSARQFRRVQAELNRWSKWHPFRPSSLGSGVGILQARQEDAFRVVIEAEWKDSGGKSRPTVRHLDTVAYEGELPPELVLAARGEKLLGKKIGQEKPTTVKEIIRTVLDATQGQIDREWAKAEIRPFLVQAEDGGNQARLEAATVTLTRIPVLHLTCGFKDPAHPNASKRFQVWLYGEEQELRFDGLPERWTWKASAWVAGCFAVGLPLGYLLANLR